MSEFAGSLVAVVTPFRDDAEQSVDLEQLGRLVQMHAEGEQRRSWRAVRPARRRR
jgi:dihydrodipicolinate synthase/N-acetylneuraminate lyase